MLQLVDHQQVTVDHLQHSKKNVFKRVTRRGQNVITSFEKEKLRENVNQGVRFVDQFAFLCSDHI